MYKFLGLAPLVLLGACAVGPDFHAPAAPAAEAGYAPEGAGDGAGRAMLGEGPETRWWTAFGSSELDGLVNRALASNHGLAASKATLERARAQIAAVAPAPGRCQCPCRA